MLPLRAKHTVYNPFLSKAVVDECRLSVQSHHHASSKERKHTLAAETFQQKGTVHNTEKALMVAIQRFTKFVPDQNKDYLHDFTSTGNLSTAQSDPLDFLKQNFQSWTFEGNWAPKN